MMLDSVPDENLANLGTELKDSADSKDIADSTEKEWENSAIKFDKPVDKE